MTEMSALGLKVTATGITKTTSELDAFALASTRASAASKPINVKITGSSAKALAEIRAVEKAMAGIKTAARTSVTVDTSAAIASLNKVTEAAERAKRAATFTAKPGGGSAAPSSGDVGAVNALTGAVKGLISAYAVLSAARTYATLTDESKQFTAQLRLATAETGNFAKAQEDMRRIAVTTRADLESTAQLYGKLQLNSAQLGITQLEAARATETVAKAFKISGASTVEASQGTRQLVQALQSGVLRGDEFNTMAEAAPRLQKLLADSLGVTQGALRKMAGEGELTSAKLVAAFTDKKFTASLDKEFGQLPVTFGDAMQQIRNAAVITFGAFDQGGEFSKAITDFAIGGSKGLADMELSARQLGQTVRVELAGIVGAATEVSNALSIVKGAFDAVAGTSFGGWVGDVISQMNTMAEAFNPVVQALKFIRNLGAPARAAEAARQQTKFEGGFAGRYLDKFGGSVGGARDPVAPIVAQTKATKGLTDAQREAKRAADEAQRAQEQRVKAADDYIASLERQNAEFGKSEKEIRLMEVARRIEAAATDEQRAAIKRLSDTHEMQIGIDELAKGDAWRKSHIADIQREIDLLGMEGDARARASLALEEEGFKAEALKNHVLDANGAWDEYQAKQLELINGQSFLDGEAEKAAILLDRVNALSGAMSGGIFGGITGALTSRDPIASLLGSGGIGSILGLSTNGGRKAYQEQADAISSSLEKVFGVSGVFAKTLAGALQGSSLGSLGGGLVGLNNAGSSIGGALGGALMSGGLGKSITKGLTGAFGNAIGGALSSAVPVLGGIAGGLLGSLLKKDKYGSAVVGNGGINAMGGNNSESRSGANQIATTLSATLAKMADTFNTTMGQFAVSIGVTNGKINVNPGSITGMIGTTKQSDTIDFGEDQAAALKYAIQNAIEDGALAGLSEGWKKFLLYSDDVEGQFQKLSNLQSAYNELDSIKDPQAYALKALDKTFAELRETAYRAGDDLARVEELYQLKRKDIIEQATNDSLESERAAAAIRVDRLSVEGKTEEALALARQLQIDAADALAQAEYRQLYTAQDAATAAQKLADAQAEQATAADRVIALQIRLSRAGGDDVTAKALERMQELNSAQSDQEREMLRMIYATDDLMERQASAAEATNLFANMIMAVSDAAHKASDELRAFANEMFDEAAASDPAVLLNQIQAAMLSGNAAALPDLLKAYQPYAEAQSGSLAEYQRQIAYLRQGSLNTADLNDAKADQSANASMWYMRQLEATGGGGNWSATMPDQFYEDQNALSATIAEKLDKVAELLQRANDVGIGQIVATEKQTRLLDDATDGGNAMRTVAA